MRANRLLTLLMKLQARGQATAPELASECDVSLRTVYRDIESLQSLGIPIDSERGSAGGYRLRDGYRTRLNGLSTREVEAVFLAGLNGQMHDLGLGNVVDDAELKLLSALPKSLREHASRLRSRFYLDAPGWFSEPERPSCLPEIATAVWEQRVIQISYKSWKGVRRRELRPLGIVLKGGGWYLVARSQNESRTYRIARVLELKVLEAQFEFPESFNLKEYWNTSTQRLRSDLYPDRARIRITAAGLKRLDVLLSPYVRAGVLIEPDHDQEEWYLATVPIGATEDACSEFLKFGAEVEVLHPESLREAMTDAAVRVSRLYTKQR